MASCVSLLVLFSWSSPLISRGAPWKMLWSSTNIRLIIAASRAGKYMDILYYYMDIVSDIMGLDMVMDVGCRNIVILCYSVFFSWPALPNCVAFTLLFILTGDYLYFLKSHVYRSIHKYTSQCG